MKKIKTMFIKEGQIERIRKNLINLLEGSLKIIEKTPPVLGDDLYKANTNYFKIYNLTKSILLQKELKKIEKKYHSLQKLWVYPKK